MRQVNTSVTPLSAVLCIGALTVALVMASFAHVQPAKAVSPNHQSATGLEFDHSDGVRTHQLSSSTPLTYYGGPVMQSTSTTYAIFWEPATLQDGTPTYVSPNYNSLIERYFADIGGSGLYNNNTQYYDTTGHIINSSEFGGAWVDVSPYPASGCKDSYTPRDCLSYKQLKAEIITAMAVNGWTGGLNHVFFIFTSWGEGSCNILGHCAFANYCAYHANFTDSGQSVLYADMPYEGTDLSNCGVPQSPNNDFDADSSLNLTSHEHMEAVTDPLGSAWHDASDNEVGDKCDFQFGTLSLDGGLANAQWNGHYYIVQQEWSNALGRCVMGRSVSGALYFGSDDENVYAVNAGDGSQVWNPPFSTGNSVFSSPKVVSGVVYVGSNDGNVYALNSADGSKLWSCATGGAVTSSPTASKGLLYIGSSDGNVYALNASTGKRVWAFATTGPVASSPRVLNGVVYIGSSNGTLYALKASTGKQVWSYTTPSEGVIDSQPVVSNGLVYFSSNDGWLYALNAAAGTFAWSYSTGSAIFHSSPVVAKGIVYIGSSNGSIYALNSTNGSLKWSYATGGEVLSTPSLFNGVVYFGSWDHNVYALSAASGTYLWSYASGDRVSSSPAVVDGVLYFGSDDQSLYALWADDGSPFWSSSFRTGGSIESSPAVSLTSF